jgi:hypothetical protein
MRFTTWTGVVVVLSLGLALGMRTFAPTSSISQLIAESAQRSARNSLAEALAPRASVDAASKNERQSPPTESRTRASATIGMAQARSDLPSTGQVDAGGLHRFDKEGLHETMQSAMPEIDLCYEEWLKVEPKLGGRMNVRFTINTEDGVEGQVSQVSVGDAGTGNVAFEGCVLSVISALRFEPPLDGEITVSYPLAFVAPPSPPEELQPELVNLCQRIRSEAQRSELAEVPLDDLLTAVISSLEQQTPGLRVYFAALLPSDVPPVQRKETFKRAISKAIGREWACPEFEALWDGKPI